MLLAYYLVMMILSVLFSFAYALLWKKERSTSLTILFAIFPLANIGYLIFSLSQTLEEALSAERFIYLGGCFVGYFMMTLILDYCKVEIPKAFRMIYFTLSGALYIGAALNGYINVFYLYVYFHREDDVVWLTRGTGFMFYGFFALNFVYMLMNFTILIYSLVKQKEVSRLIVFLFLAAELVLGGSFIAEQFLFGDIQFSPAAFVIAQILFLLYLLIGKRYDVSLAEDDTFGPVSETGVMIFDKSFHYLGSNEKAKDIIPELMEVKVDTSAARDGFLREYPYEWLNDYKNTSRGSATYTKGHMIYNVDVELMDEGPLKNIYRISLWEQKNRPSADEAEEY